MDPVDTKIVRSLMTEGRITNTRLARAVGLSESATLERVRRLESSGVIQGYGARVDPQAVGRKLEVIMAFTLRKQKPEDVIHFGNAMTSMDEVLDCAQVLGRFDFIAHVALQDVPALESFIHDKVIPLGLVDRMESLTVLKTLKRAHPPLPLSEA
ncbi:MAG TPA: Lrp/AsnC family transcriptional regulator [Candidatus Krumholzibacteria bacterium]|nr:Lrp/AsnC family transcriptional regulator [Candidatus Krumholzibacteria bacterium]